MTQVRPPRVSIVMPTFNSASFLKSTVDSVRAQTFGDWQLVLADDGSCDTTLAITDGLVETDPRIMAVRAGHAGVAVTRQRGWRHSDPGSEFVAFLDSDDTWEPEALAVLVDALDSEPDCGAAYGLARGTDMDGHQYENDDLPDLMRRRDLLQGGQSVDLAAGERTPFGAMLLKNCVVTPGTALIRRSALDRIGGVDASTEPADDWDLFIRLARDSDLLLVDRVILNWRRHPDSLSNTSKRWSRAWLVVRTRTIQSPDNSAEQRGAALDALRADCRSWRRHMVAGLRRRDPHETARAVVYVLASSGMYARWHWFTRDRRSLSAVARNQGKVSGAVPG